MMDIMFKGKYVLGWWWWAQTLGFQDLACMEPTEFPKVIESSRGRLGASCPGQRTGLSAEENGKCLFINRPGRFSVKVTFQIFKKHNTLFINLFCVHVWVGTCVPSCTWGGQHTTHGTSFYQAGTGLGDQTWIITLGATAFSHWDRSLVQHLTLVRSLSREVVG